MGDGARDTARRVYEAPPVSLGGTEVFQAIIQELKDAEPVAEPRLQFHVYCVPEPADQGAVEDSDFTLFADLQAQEGRWFVGVTSVSPVTFRPGTAIPTRTTQAANEILDAIGPWVADGVYDHLATAARALLALVPGCPIAVPRLTPEPHLAHVSSRDDAVHD